MNAMRKRQSTSDAHNTQQSILFAFKTIFFKVNKQSCNALEDSKETQAGAGKQLDRNRDNEFAASQ